MLADVCVHLYTLLPCQVRSITRCHPDLLQQNFVKTSPLHLAARNGHVSVIASLITAGMDVNTLVRMGSVRVGVWGG